MSKLERASFGSKLGVILATAGSAVGLGNIWRGPEWWCCVYYHLHLLCIVAWHPLYDQ